jgi:hypothetical protein
LQVADVALKGLTTAAVIYCNNHSFAKLWHKLAMNIEPCDTISQMPDVGSVTEIDLWKLKSKNNGDDLYKVNCGTNVVAKAG